MMPMLRTFLVLLCLALAAAGCSQNAALVKGQERLDVSSESLALLSVKISNRNAPDYQPFPFMVFVAGSGEGTYSFSEDGPNRSEKSRFREYLLSFSLKPGVSRFDKIWFDYRGTFMGARARIPINMQADIKPGTVHYLGHLDVVIRPKTSNGEESAGAALSLVDQAVAGFSTGTFDVNVSDRFEEDAGWFASEYPVLKSARIEKTILQPVARSVK
jgi:hypothetical protein